MRKYRGTIIRTLLAVILIALMVLPASMVYAETPVSVSTVLASVSAYGIGDAFQHHSFIDSGVTWAFYLDNINSQINGLWSEDGRTFTPLAAPIHYCYGGITCAGAQFDTWWDVNSDTVHFVIVNSSVNNSPILYAKYTVAAHAHTLTLSGAWETVVAGIANVSYRTPTICVTNNETPFITYGYNINGSSDVYLTATNNSTSWVNPVGLPMHNLSVNASRPTEFGSVIPYATATNNVSIQYAEYNGSVYKIKQQGIEWNGLTWAANTSDNIDTSEWYLYGGFEDDYNAVSIPTGVNTNDVAVQCLQTNNSSYRVFFNRKGAAGANEWNSTWARNFGAGNTTVYQSVGAMGIRSTAYNLVYSAWTMGDNWIYSNDYSLTTGNWSGLAKVYNDSLYVPLYNTMATYKQDFSGAGYTGFLYGSVTTDALRYGQYGTVASSVTKVPASVDMMAWVVILVFGALICLVMLAIGASQAIRGGSTELVKAGLVGIITLIIVATIVAATL